MPRSAGYGLSVADEDTVKVLRSMEDKGNTTIENFTRVATPYQPALGKQNVVSMTIADGRKLVAVTAEDSDLLVVSNFGSQPPSF